jgi:hypothetical protein
MTSHNCPTNHMLHMIKHDPNILQIPYKLHSCDKIHSIPHTIYGHLENEHLLSKNLSKEITLLDVVISTFRLQFKDVIIVTTTWTMLEKNNKVTNIGRVQFTEIVLDLPHLPTFEKLHFTITTIIKQMPSQESLTSTGENRRHLHIRHAINLLYNQPSSLLQRFPSLAIRNKMVLYPKMNCCS